MITIVIFVGSGTFFQQKVYVETYFNESVQGLSEGSPVKYLGIDIGYVKEITQIDNVYKINRTKDGQTKERYVYVLMVLNNKFFRGIPNSKTAQTIAKDVASGLRFQITLQNVTGTAYIELKFVEPQRRTSLPIMWQPKHYYIPSTQSTLSYLKSKAVEALAEISQINFKGMVHSMNQLTIKIDNLFKNSNQQLIETVDNIHTISENLSSFTEQTKDFPSYTLFGNPPPKLDPSKL